MHHGHVTKSRNRKLIRVTSSNEGLKHMCVDLSDYIRYLNQIWYITQIFRKNVSNFGLDREPISCIKLYGKMHHSHAEMTT